MKKYLCLDIGTTTIGIASSDMLGIAHPKEEYRFPRGNYREARKHICELMASTNIYSIVIGYPLQIDRKEGERCESVRRFMDDLRNDCPGVMIYPFDESYSTVEAHERLKESGYKEEKIKEVIDMYSAVVILEDYLENKINVKLGNE
jgi:RNAse H-fold protein YqgF